MSDESAPSGNINAHTVRAQVFEVVDENGSTRAKLYTGDDGTPVVAMYDVDMHPRVAISLNDKDNPGIVYFTADGVAQLEIRIEEGVPEIRLYDPDGLIRTAIYVEENRPAVSFFDSAETLRLSLYLEKDGAPSVTFFDASEKLARQITTSAE